MKKIVKKTIKKTVKPDFIMNCVTNITPTQLYNEAINAKIRAGKAITENELNYAKDVAIAEIVDELAKLAIEACMSIPCKTFEVKNGETLVFDERGNAKVKKPNIFRRFWNWVTRKK